MTVRKTHRNNLPDHLFQNICDKSLEMSDLFSQIYVETDADTMLNILQRTTCYCLFLVKEKEGVGNNLLVTYLECLADALERFQGMLDQSEDDASMDT